MKDLEKLRQEIDDCDKELVAILEKRMGKVLDIMEYKKEKGIPIFHQAREKEILQKVTTYLENPGFSQEIKTIYSQILKASRKVQSRTLFPYHISLIGFMGSGKTTIGKELSKLLAMENIDVDKVIEERMGMTINEIFQNYGETYFRKLEAETVEEMSRYNNIIIFCSGGGIVLNHKNVENLKRNGIVIWLQASPEEIYSRISQENTRPLLKDSMTVEKIQEMLGKREGLYEAAADITVCTDGKTVEEISKEIIEKLMKRLA
ncbi:MAG: chorismate mutase [Bacillota bacterium]